MEGEGREEGREGGHVPISCPQEWVIQEQADSQARYVLLKLIQWAFNGRQLFGLTSRITIRLT